MIQDSLETMDQMLQDSALRLKYWVVESHTTKQLITSLGMVTFWKTLFRNRETGHSEYLLDRILGLERNERLTEDAVVKLLNEAVQTSYRRGGGSLQKNNNLITKLVYIYEGIENEPPKSKRLCLINPHYFCGVNTGEGSLKFWKTIYDYMEHHYDVEKVKKIYLNAKGSGCRIQGFKR